MCGILRKVFDSVTDAIFLHDPESGKIVEVNRRACDLFGYPFEQMVQMSVSELSVGIAPFTQEEALALIRGAELGKNKTFEWQAKDISGRIFWVSCTICRVEQDGTELVLVTARDIDEMKKNSERLAESEEKFRAFFEQSMDAVVVIDPATGKMTAFNRPAHENLGYSREEFAGFTLSDFEAAESSTEVHEHIAKILSEGQGDFATRHRHKDGRILDVRVNARALKLGGKQQILSTWHDITPLLEAQRSIKKQEEHYKALSTMFRLMADNMPDMLWAKDMNCRFLFANQAICDRLLFAKDTEEPIGRDDLYFALRTRAEQPDNPKWHTFGELCQNSDLVVIEDQEARRFDEYGTVRGEYLFLDVFKAPIFDDAGTMIGTVGCGRDVTREKQLEAENEQMLQEKKAIQEKLNEARKMEAIGLMAGGVAHDLNNILSGVVSYPELISMQLPADSPLQESLQIIQQSGKRAAAVVGDLLTVARGVASEKKVVDLKTLLRSHLDNSRQCGLADRFPTVKLTLDLPDESATVRCSPVHVKQCLANLLVNAAEALEGEGAILLALRHQYLERPLLGKNYVDRGEYVVLSVQDDGHGMQEADIERIFEPFYSKKMMGRSGTGLGLAIVWNTMQDHGGGVTVTSSEEGILFELYFPLCREQLTEEGSDQEDEGSIQGNGETILVVDDEEMQRRIAGELLQSLGYRVKRAGSGEDALQYLKDHAVELVLLDMVMDPGMNGRETYEQILLLHPGQHAVIASGYAETEEVTKAQALGAGSFVGKPYSRVQLGRVIKKELARSCL